MRRRISPFLPLLALVCALSAAGTAHAQSGSFVIPAIRSGSGADFAYWDYFDRPPGATTATNFNYANPPALIDGFGEDEEGNLTTAYGDRATLTQNGTSTAFITSSHAIYSFSAITAFEVDYVPPASSTGEVTNVIFQTQTGGSRLNVNSVQLVYVESGNTHTLAPQYRALDDPQTGNFSERLVSAFQWDLTGLGVRDFKIVFSAPDASMPLWEAQLDTVVGQPFVQQLGYILMTRARPALRHGRPGTVSPVLPPGTDSRFFLPGTTVNLASHAEDFWEGVGWFYDGQVYDTTGLSLTFPAQDITVTGLFAPLTYEAWRELAFFHFNSLIGTRDDYLDDDVSAPSVDHDHDGMDNLLEYAFGCDPYTPDAARAMEPMSTLEISGQFYPCIVYRTNGAPEGSGDVTYHVQVSSDLGDWTDNRTSPTTVTVSRVRQSDGTVLVTERTLQNVESFSRCFMQVIVEE